MELISYNEYLEQEKRIYAKADLTGENDIIVNRDVTMFPKWEDLLNTLVKAGTVVVHEDIKYLTVNDVTPIESQLPNGQGMLAIYKPYRDDGVYEWLYGEYVKIGWQRTVGDNLYTAIADPNANIYSPELVPNIWRLEE